MIDQIINTYGDFPDGLVSEVKYYQTDNFLKAVEVTILCLNNICFENIKEHKNQECYEYVKLVFDDVEEFRLIDSGGAFALGQVLIKKENQYVIFDFDPNYGRHDDIIIEDMESVFKIKAKSFTFNVLDPYRQK